MLGRRSATILSIFMTTVMLGSIIAVTMPSSYVQGSDNNDIKKLELSTTDTQVDTKRLAKVNLPFIENNGQTHEDVKYYTSTFAGNAFVTEDHITYSLMKSSPKEEDGENQIRGVALKESFLTKEALHPRGLDRSDSIVNYFVGAEENWRSNVPTYNAVSLGELWPYVDVELKAYGANIEKIFKVYPGGSVEDIRLSLDGVLSLNVDEKGELILETELGDLAMTKPVAFQDIDVVQKDVEAFYLVEGSTYGFAVGDYDPHYPLVIDPLLVSTFIGGGGDDRGFAIALDSSDNVFVTGFTGSSDYPTTTGAFDETHNGSLGVLVTKLKNDLSGPLLASTFISGGGNLFDFGIAIALYSSDNVFVTGFTGSSDYPTTTGAFDETHNGGRDVFVTKLKNDLSGPLLASTIIGGGGDDRGLAIVLDSSGNLLVAGLTTSSNYPTITGAFDETYNGDSDVFVTKLKNDLSGPLLASTFIGRSVFERGTAIALDSSDNVFVTGFTGSSDYPTTTGAFDETHNGDSDVFVTKLKNDLSGPLLASTIIGGGEDDRGLAIVLDSSGNLLVAGLTTSSNYPTTTGAFDETYNGSLDVFVTKLTGDLSLMEATAEPHTTIDSAVDGNSIVVLDGGSTISDSMTFTFSGTDDSGVASFECDIDIGGFSACESPLDLTSLSDSFHNFMVRAIDNSGNTDSTPVSFSWTSSPVSEGDILVIDGSAGTSSLGALFSVDPSGNRTIISDFGNAAQGALGFGPTGVAIDTSGQILVIDGSAGTSSLGALFSVDPSGNRTIISDFGNAAQGALGSFPSGVVIFPDTNNQQPIADAGPDQTVIEGLLVTLDGTGSSDPDGDSITYSWTQTSGTNVTLSNATIANPTFVAPSTTEEIMLGFSLVVNDGLLDSLPDSVVITVSPIISGISCLQEPTTIVGTEGNDVIVGTEGDDVIHGLGGNDIIRGLGGNDLICGGDGDDELIGGLGNDKMAGGTGNDGMYGVQGRDVLYGNPGNDSIFGGGENDIVYGGLGDDIINGGTGDDALFGGPDDDTLFGGDGIDELHGGTGLNVCSTGETLVDCI